MAVSIAARRAGVRRHKAGGFRDTFTRSDRSLSGDNGWSIYGGGTHTITSNRYRCNVSGTGFPGGSSDGAGIYRQVVPSNPGVVDLSFDLVVGAGDTTGGFYAVIGGLFGATTWTKGIVLRGDKTAPNWMFLENFTTPGSAGNAIFPASNPSLVGTTTTVRMMLVRSTGVVTLYQNGVLLLTSSAGWGTGFTDNYISLSVSAYNGTTNAVECSNLVVA